MNISGKMLAIAGAFVLVGYVLVNKFATPSVLAELTEEPQQKWLVLGKSIEGGMASDQFETFFKSMNDLKKAMGDSLPELTRYYEEPTKENGKHTLVFSGVIVPDSTFSQQGFVLKEIVLPASVQVKHRLSAGLYPAIDEYAELKKIKLDKDHVVEILAKDYTAILMQKK